MIKGNFCVPTYYKNFKCKGNDCRKCCCGGWGITLSKKEYYKILNVDCSKELKDKICAYVTVLKDATDERYAKINLNYYGECPLRLENGYCGLQVEVGEEEIPSICRYYPRSPRLIPEQSALISSSCEWVIEELMKDNDPISFENLELSFNFEKSQAQYAFPTNFREIMWHSIRHLGDRNIDFITRLNEVGLFLHADLNKYHIMYLKEAVKILCGVYLKNHSIGEYVEKISFEDKLTFAEMTSTLKSYFPDLDIYFEKFFMNHAMFMLFPYVSIDLSAKDSFISLYLIYHFYLAILYFNLKSADKNLFVDITSEYFRIAEHSNLYNVCQKVINLIDSKTNHF